MYIQWHFAPAVADARQCALENAAVFLRNRPENAVIVLCGYIKRGRIFK